MSELYPFAGHYLERGPGLRLHYLDEGVGPPVVMVHGNPTWSFYFRNLVLALRGSHRCIAPDHVGCGLSSKPTAAEYDFSLQSRVSDLTALLDRLTPAEPVTLVLHDWGGMIGMAWAARHPERVARIVALNTAAFRLPAGKPLPLLLRLGRDTGAGAWSIRRLNLFCRLAARVGVRRRPLPAAVRAEYLRPYGTAAHRLAVERFVRTIPLKEGDAGWDIVREVEASLGLFRGRPVFLGWGLRDFVFDGHFLAEWRRHFPDAEVHAYADAGHYVLEDAGAELVPLIRAFLRGE